MPATVSVNKRTVVHKKSDGKSIAFPDVCLTPCGPSMVPIPYPNIAMSSDMENGASSVHADGQPMGHEKSYFAKSTGDEAGTGKGTASGTNKGKAEFVNFSFDVTIEGKGVVRAFEQMIHNNKNTPPTVLLQPPSVVTYVDETPEVPKQDAVTVKFIGPFGEPMEGLPVDVAVDGEEKSLSTMSRGQIVHVADKKNVSIAIRHDELGIEEKE